MPPGCWKLQIRVFVGLGLVLATLWIALVVVPAVKERRRKSREFERWYKLELCQANLHALALACQDYSQRHGSYPQSLQNLYESGELGNPLCFSCPVTRDRDTLPDRRSEWREFAGQVGYGYRHAPASSSHRYVIAWDLMPHPDGRRCVVSKDGRQKAMEEPEFESAKAEWK